MSLVSWAVDQAVPGGRVRAGFTSRFGGVSSGPYASLNLGQHVGDDSAAVAKNRALLAQELGAAPGWMDQVHGARLAAAVAGSTEPATDGLLVSSGTSGAGTSGANAACVMVADCVPLLLLRTDTPGGAAVHVGRAGFLAGIAANAVRALGAPESTIAVLGPSICGGCYEVPEHMAAAAGQVEPSAVSQTRWGTPSIDIPRGLRAQLERSGVTKIVDTGVCTRESEDYFSHRHASESGQPTGRFVGVVHVMGDSPADCGDTPAQPHGAGGEGLIP